MTGSGKRYTDREVALVLKRAAELEEKRTDGDGSGAGLTLAQLEEIARDVGLDPDLVAEAALELESRRSLTDLSILGPQATRKSVHAVPGRVDEAGLRALIQVVDDRAPSDGIVTEALGTVRWTATDRFRSTQVTLAPAGDETRIQVTQRFNGRVRPILHLLPAAWGGIAVMGIGAGLGFVGAPLAALVAGGAIVGGGVGRVVWHMLSAHSGRGVERLADELATDAARLARVEEPK